MREYVDRLQAILAKSELTPVEVKDGIVSTYVLISSINQTEGDSDVGLKQDAEGLFSHIDGFMGAVFWERGYDIDNPTLEQVAETKVMMDGMTQIYAMPENIQSAFNDIYKYLSNKAKGMAASLTAETNKLLQLDDTPVSAADTADTLPPAEEAATSEVDQIISELPSEMESNWDTAPLPMYPASEAKEADTTEDMLIETAPVMPDSKTPEMPVEEPPVIPDSETAKLSNEPPPAAEFDPSKVLEEEPPVMAESEPPGAAEEIPKAEEFNPRKILEEEPSVVTEGEAIPEDADEPVIPGFDTSTSESEEPVMSSKPDKPIVSETPAESIASEETKPAATTGEAWNYEVLSTPEVPSLTGESTAADASASETTEEKPKKRRERKKKVKKVVEKKAKKRGRPRKKVVADKDKTKRKRNIKAKNLKINLSAINIPDDYMAENLFAPAYTEEPEVETPTPIDIPPTVEPAGAAAETTEMPLPAESEPFNDDETAFEDDGRQEIGEMEPETPVPSFGVEMPTTAELQVLGVESPSEVETKSFELPDIASTPEPSATETTSTDKPSIDVSGFSGLDDILELPDELIEHDVVDRRTGAEPVAIMEEPNAIPLALDDTSSQEAQYKETAETLTPDEETAAAESKSSEEITESEESVSREDVTPGESDSREEISYAKRTEEEPAPESSPSLWTELQNEPVEGEMPMSQDMPSEMYSKPDSGTEFEETPVSNAEIASELPPRKGGSPLLAILALVLGLALGGGAGYYWFGVLQANQMKDKIQTLEKQVEESKHAQEDLAKVQAEVKAFSEVINGQMAASKLPVPKPQYYKVGKGALVYWVDNSPVTRKYYLYRAKGRKGELKKISDKPQAKNMLLFRKVSRGTWQYAVSAVDLDGNETEKSEVLILKFPLQK